MSYQDVTLHTHRDGCHDTDWLIVPLSADNLAIAVGEI